MSSSRRSSSIRSSRPSSKPPVWRSMSISKRSTPASVSLIFAEPEQGAPLTSAATATTNLPTGKGMGSGSTIREGLADGSTGESTGTPSESASNAAVLSTQGDNEDTPAQSAVNSHPIIVSDLTSSGSDPAVTIPMSESPESLENALPAESVDTTPVPFPTSSTPDAKSAPSSRVPSSWFGSIARTKAKDDRAKLEVHNVADQAKKSTVSLNEADLPSFKASSNVSQPILQVQPPTPPQLSTSSQSGTGAQAIPISQGSQSKRSWFSSPPSSTTLQRPMLSPTFPSPLSSSSIDSNVPTPPTTPPANTESNVIPMMQVQPAVNDVGVSLNTLNPSASRFTLSIPLLGRPKIPLERAVAVAQQESIFPPPPSAEANVIKLTENGTMNVKSAPGTAQPTQAVPTSPPADPAAPLSNPPSQDPQTASYSGGSNEPQSHSWWDYVKFGYGNPAGTAQDTTQDQVSKSPSGEETGVGPSSAGDAAPKALVDSKGPEGAKQLSPSNPATIDSQSTDVDPLVAGSSTTPADVEFSSATKESAGEQEGRVGASVWYSPWAWYGSGKEAAQAHGSSGLSDKEESAEEIRRKNEEEEEKKRLVQEAEEAAARITSEALAVSQERDKNPIESSISTNVSGWASFFTGKGLIMKTITASGDDVKRDRDGMEVMDLDEESEVGDVKGKGDAAVNEVKPGTLPKRKDAPAQLPKKKLPTSKDSTPPNSPAKSETPKKGPAVPPLTNDPSVKRETAKATKRKSGSPTPSKKSGTSTPVPAPRPPNLVLPTWTDTFHAPPRNLIPPVPVSTLGKTLKLVSGFLFAPSEPKEKEKGKWREREWERREREFVGFGRELPRAYDVLLEETGGTQGRNVLRGCNKVVVIGVHGWFPGTVVRTVLGEPTGTSTKFVNMMVQALEEFQEKHNVKLQKITKIPLEGEGTIDRRVEKHYDSMLSNQEWLDDLHAADVIFVATHSQGSIVSTHLLDRLIRDRHIRTSLNSTSSGAPESFSAAGLNVTTPARPPQRVCCLALCGIHLGPLRYLSSSSLFQPYIQYFESAAARELFEFQDTESAVSKSYVKALSNVLGNMTKMVYIASLDDQAVPIYSGLFTAVSHPLILRALYIDGDAYHSSDFLSNLLVLLLRVLNSGIPDSGLLVHLSEATAGSLNGVGHSTAYEELSTYSLAVNYLFLTNDGLEEHPELTIESFNAMSEQNDYEIPWALRDLIADERVDHFFAREILELRNAFREWHPKTAILRDIKRKLQPIQRLPPSFSAAPSGSISKL